MDAREHLERWREAGLIDEATAGRVLEFEAGRRQATAVKDEDRPGVLEALAYLGVAVAAVGAVALAAERWDELRSWARTAAVAVPALLALLAGIAMQQVPEAGIKRGGQVAWLAATALFAAAIAVIFEEYGDGAGDRDLLLLNGLAVMLLALVLWASAPSPAQVLGVGGALVFLGMAIGQWPDDFETQLAGMSIFAVAVAVLVAAEAGLFAPLAAARLVFGALAAFGPYFAGLDGSILWAETLVFAVGGALCVLSIVRASFTYMVVGVTAIFTGLVTFVFEHFSEELGAPVALLLSGGLLIAGVLILSQVRGVVRQRRAAA